MEYNSLRKMPSFTGIIPDTALHLIMNHIEDPWSRDAMSLVCKKWYSFDAETRKHVTIALCYSTSPHRLTQRFPNLESIKLKGKPRAAMFNLIPEDWGGYAGPWINEIATRTLDVSENRLDPPRDAFECLKYIHFRRMIVTDENLNVLIQARGNKLVALKMDKCSGFSTDGLTRVAQSCRSLKILFLEESIIIENDGQWLHELAVHNTVLETLNFYMTELKVVNCEYLEMIARNCHNLVSMKISDADVSDMIGFYRAATSLEEFGGGSFNDQVGEITRYDKVKFPSKLCGLCLSYMGKNEMHVIFPFAAALKKLDLQYTFLSTEDHCQLIQQCPRLEVLEVRNVIGDRGLEILAQRCKSLKRLRIERGDDEQGLEDEQGMVTQVGLSTIARGCPKLEYLAVYASDITNGALQDLGIYGKNLCDFRLVLLDNEENITDLPLDNGVRALLIGCTKLRRFALYLRHGGLTDVGLGYIGQYSTNVRWMLLGYVGESDAGLLRFSEGCPSLQKLELRGCCFSERALALAVMKLTSMRYIWVQGYNGSPNGNDLLAMVRPYWNIEFIPPRQIFVDNDRAFEQPAQILAYYSLAGRRNDYPASVIPLFPTN